MNEKLQSVLGEDGMVELRALIAASTPTPASVQRPQWQAFLLGLAKSWTAWFAGFLIALPELAQLVMPQLQEMLDAQTYKRIMQLSAVVMLLLRAKTNTSLVDKGSKPAPPASP